MPAALAGQRLDAIQQRIKSFCVAKPMQKLRWTERVGAEGSAAAYGIFSRDWALEATA
jgi:hypothetical protein